MPTRSSQADLPPVARARSQMERRRKVSPSGKQGHLGQPDHPSCPPYGRQRSERPDHGRGCGRDPRAWPERGGAVSKGQSNGAVDSPGACHPDRRSHPPRSQRLTFTIYLPLIWRTFARSMRSPWYEGVHHGVARRPSLPHLPGIRKDFRSNAARFPLKMIRAVPGDSWITE